MITSKKNCKIRQTMYLNYKPIKYEIMKLDEKKDEKTGSSQFELAWQTNNSGNEKWVNLV